MQNIAVILAAGCGIRLNSDLPKQFSTIGDLSVIEYSLKAFENHPKVDSIIVVGHPDYLDLIGRISGLFSKVLAVISGGSTRSLSSYAALTFLSDDQDDDKCVIFHDAARPFVDHKIISNIINALSQYEAATVAIKSSDTMLITTQNGRTIQSIPDRSLTYQMQTPQGFIFNKIKSAHDLAIADRMIESVTDDCGLFRYAYPDSPIAIVEGNRANNKITYQEDLDYLRYLAGKR